MPDFFESNAHLSNGMIDRRQRYPYDGHINRFP